MTQRTCQCEHLCHETGDGHAYLAVPAGSRRAEFVGPICDECADTHMSIWVIPEDPR